MYSKSNPILIATCLATVLSGCGGGGGSTSNSTVNSPATIQSIGLSQALVRGEQSQVTLECSNCLSDQAEVRWEMDDVVINTGSTFTPDFEHLRKTLTVYVKVPNSQQQMSAESSARFYVEPRVTEITSIALQGELLVGQLNQITFDCNDCNKKDAEIQWQAAGVTVSQENAFIPTIENHGQDISVVVSVPSIDLAMSEPKQADFKRRIVSKVISGSGLDAYLMSDGELIWESANARNWPESSDMKFVDMKYTHTAFGNILALDDQGNYHEFGESYADSAFSAVQDKLGTVIDYWVDASGHHVLNDNNEVVTWRGPVNGERAQFALSQEKVENVKQVVSNIVNSGFSDFASAILFNDGELLIESIDYYSGTTYHKKTLSNVKKIQGLTHSRFGIEHLAIFDQQDNVEIWSDRLFGGQNYTNVEKIITAVDHSDILVIKKDGSFSVSHRPQNIIVLADNVKAVDLIEIGRSQLAVLGDDGHAYELSNGERVPMEELSQDFLLEDLAYSQGLHNSTSFILAKNSGQVYLGTERSPTVVEDLQFFHAPPNYFFTVNSGRLNTFKQRDSNESVAEEGFSNGLGYVEDVMTFFPMSNGVLVLNKNDEATLVRTHGNLVGYPLIEKFQPQITQTYFGSVED